MAERKRRRSSSSERVPAPQVSIRDLRARVKTLEERVDRRSDKEQELERRMVELERIQDWAMVRRQEAFLREQYPEAAPQEQETQAAPQEHVHIPPQVAQPSAFGAVLPALQPRPRAAPVLRYEAIPHPEAKPYAVWKRFGHEKRIYCISCRDGGCSYTTLGPYLRHCASDFHRFFLRFSPPKIDNPVGPLKEWNRQDYKWATGAWDEAAEQYQQWTAVNGPLAY